MNGIQALLSEPWVARLGWTLIHFAWQGAAIAAAYALMRAWMPPGATGPRGRYSLACIAFVLMAAAPVVTYWLEGTGAGGAGTSAAPHAVTSVNPVTAGVPPYAVTGSSIEATLSWSSQALPWVVAIWFAGTLLCWVRLLGGCAVAARMRSTLVHPAPAEWRERFAKLCAGSGVTGRVRLLISCWVRVPMVVGWLRPVVLIPVGVLAGLAPDQVEAVLVHELAHIRRHDYLVNILQGVVEALLFYHPAVWWISGHIRAERELCCDDSVVAAGGDAANYARALAELATLQSGGLGAAMAVSGGSLTERIARLLGQPEASPRALPIPGVVTIALIVCAAAWGFAQSPAPARPQFEVASLKPAAGCEGGTNRRENLSPSPGRLEMPCLNLASLLQVAYGTFRDGATINSEPLRVEGGPSWINSERYSLSAKADGPVRTEMLAGPMLQALLEERFMLKTHREAREMPVYAMTVAKGGLKVKALAEGSCTPIDLTHPPDLRNPGDPPPNICGLTMLGPGGKGYMMLEVRGSTMKQFAQRLSGRVDRSVVDKTGIPGMFNFHLEFTPDPSIPGESGPRGNAEPADPDLSVFVALQEQIGLKLSSDKGPVSFLIVDHVEKPTAN